MRWINLEIKFKWSCYEVPGKCNQTIQSVPMANYICIARLSMLHPKWIPCFACTMNTSKKACPLKLKLLGYIIDSLKYIPFKTATEGWQGRFQRYFSSRPSGFLWSFTGMIEKHIWSHWNKLTKVISHTS